MNVVYKPKSVVRQETSESIQQFLASGGQIQIVPAKKTRKRTTQKMSSKSSKGYNTGTSGFASGFPRKSTI
jgi:hypothetical protein